MILGGAGALLLLVIVVECFWRRRNKRMTTQLKLYGRQSKLYAAHFAGGGTKDGPPSVEMQNPGQQDTSTKRDSDVSLRSISKMSLVTESDYDPQILHQNGENSLVTESDYDPQILHQNGENDVTSF